MVAFRRLWALGVLLATGVGVAGTTNDVVRYSADLPGWRVTDMNDIEIRAGSALDLSSLGGPDETGRLGALTIAADGHLALASDRGRRIKLYGYVADWSDFVNYWRDKPKEEFHRLIDAFAVQVRRHGFNFVRPHGMLDLMETPNWQPTPQLTPDWIDRIDYIAAALKRQGVYLYIDFVAYGMRLGEKPMKSPLMKTAVMSGDRTYVDAWKACTREILEHVNPYTGLAWKDDPAVAIAMEFNEQATGAKLGTLRPELRDQLPETTRAELLRRWNAWCAAKGWTEHPDWPEASKGSYAWSASFDGEPWGPRYHAFLSSLFLERAREYNEAARMFGFRGLLSAYNSDGDLGASAARWQASDVVSYNFHFGHPSSFGKGGCVSQDDSCSMTARGYDFSCGVRLRFHDRPYVSSEYSHAFWNFRRYEGGVLLPSYAALNGHDGILWHAGGVNLSAVGRWPRGRIEIFRVYTSPIMRAATFLGACLYRRGDVSEAPHKVEVAYRNGTWESMTRTAPSTEQARLGLVTRYGISFPDLPRPKGVATVAADAVLEPATGDRIRDGEWVSSVVGDKSKGFDFDACVRALKTRGILTASNRTDAASLRFESETGELMLDGREQWMTVDTPRTKAVAAPVGKRTELGAFTVSGSTEDALTAITSVDGCDLAESRRMVFIYATREANTGMVLSKDGRRMEECGWYPALLKTGRVSVRFVTPHAAALKLYLLDYSGRRLEDVAIRHEAGAVAFDLDTAKFSHGPTPLFELVAEAERPKAPFAGGQTVAFVGDSITHAGGYAFYAQLFQALRAPQVRTRVVNGGISGDQLGDLLGRWTRDVEPMKPDVLFLMEGMNDVGRGNYRAKSAAADTFAARTNALARYLANLGTAADRATKLAKDVRLVTPSPYDSYGDYGTENLESANDEGLAACAEAVRLVAAEKGLPFIELQRPLTDILKTHREKRLWGKDRVHPGDTGHLLMAAHILEQLGVSGEVATTVKDAAGRDTLAFDYAPDAFPFPALPEVASVKAVYPFADRLNRETLIVRNLPDGEYNLAFDGRSVGRFTAAALAAGVNLAELDTPNRRAAADAAAAAKEMRAKTAVLRDIRHMDLMFADAAAAEAWLEKEKNSPWIGAFRNWVSTWKVNKPREAELVRQVDAAFMRMYDVLKVKPCRVAIAPVSVKVDPNLSVFLGDVHVPGDGVALDKVDQKGTVMYDRLSRTVDEILAMDPRPARVVVFGDIAYLHGELADYRKSRPLFERLMRAGVQVVLGLGNHDRHQPFFETYPEYRTSTCVPGDVVSCVSLGTADLILLDSVDEAHGGNAGLSSNEEKWIREKLPNWPRPFFVGAHHAPRDIPFGRGALGSYLVGLRNFRGFIHGHWHTWQEWTLLDWGKGGVRRAIGLPSTGFWGDIGYVKFRTDATSATAELVQKDFYFLRYQADPSKRDPAWAWRVRENDGRTVRFSLSESSVAKRDTPMRWTGFNLLGMFRKPADVSNVDPRSPGCFAEDDFRWIHEWGFNFARLPLDYRFWIKDGDWSAIDESKVKSIDEAIDFGAKWNVHVQLCFHRAPGYCVNKPEEPKNLFRDEEAYRVCARHWAFFARRYKGIPNSRLSFDLFNEPCDVESELKTNLVRVVRGLVAAIRAEDPDRLIVADGKFCGREPIEELYDTPAVMQSIHAYLPYELSHFGAEWWVNGPKDRPSWPPKGSADGLGELERICYSKWRSARKAGVPLMVGECGFYRGVPHDVALTWMEDNLRIWQEWGVGWTVWNLRGAFGVMDSGRKDVAYEDFEGHKLDRKYLELLQKYR